LIAPPEISMMKHPGAAKIGSDGWDVALQRNSFPAYRDAGRDDLLSVD
jgi:hypothetical protein